LGIKEKRGGEAFFSGGLIRVIKSSLHAAMQICVNVVKRLSLLIELKIKLLIKFYK